MRIKRFCTIIVWVVCCGVIYFTNASFAPAHPFYVSVSEVSIITDKSEVNLSCKVFTDDLQEALYKLYKKPINLEQPSTVQTQLLQEYLTERLQVQVGTQKIYLALLGYEQEGEATWCYLQGKLTNSSRHVRIQNKLLCDFLPAQANLVHCKWNNIRKSYKLDCSLIAHTFHFE